MAKNSSKDKPTTRQLQSYGFIFNDSGYVTGINPNAFAKHILTQYKLVYSLSGKFYSYNKGVYKPMEDINLQKKLRNLLHSYVPDFWNLKREQGYMEALRREAKLIKQFDRNKNILNLENGLFDLKRFSLSEHTPDVESTVRLPINYTEDADCPRFRQFLSEVFLGSNKIIAMVQEIMGYCLTSSTKAQKAFLFLGNGANGKSTLINVIKDLCGEQNVSAVPVSDFEQPFKRHELFGKTVNLVAENEFSKGGFSTQYFKAVVGGDPISAEIKYGPTYLFRPFCKIIMAMNQLPYSRDLSDGLKRRLIIIPFDANFKEGSADKMLPEKLERERDGIFLFALEGLKRLRRNNYEFTYSKKVAKTLEDYFGNIDPLYRFVKEKVVAKSNSKVTNKDLYVEYCEWIRKEGGEAKINRLKFSYDIKSRLHSNGIKFTLGKSKDRFIKGIELVANDDLEDDIKLDI